MFKILARLHCLQQILNQAQNEQHHQEEKGLSGGLTQPKQLEMGCLEGMQKH